jgi:murein DD-endopeptidase MepM/ murein hydrolase activator NlpD
LIRGASDFRSIHISQSAQIGVVGGLTLVILSFFIVGIMGGVSFLHALRLESQAAVARGIAAARSANATSEHDELLKLKDELRARDAVIMFNEFAIAKLKESDQAALARLGDETRATIDEVNKIIASTGLDPDRLSRTPLKTSSEPDAPLGGPFLPLAGAPPVRPSQLGSDPAEQSYSLSRLKQLQDLLVHVPLTSPVKSADVTSDFGSRVDPITHRRSFHTGLDLGGGLGEPIYATAPGTVSIAGWQDDYGMMVEIGHGYGLATRYGHLSKILVKPGDKVTLHQLIGLMGMTGRATGVHLHYETRADGQLSDPANFLKVDHYVPEKTSPTSSGADDDKQ